MEHFSIAEEVQRQNALILFKVKKTNIQRAKWIISDYNSEHPFWPIVKSNFDDINRMRIELKKALIQRELILSELTSIL